jgi:hypothetical protein
VFRNCGFLRCHPLSEKENGERLLTLGALPLSPFLFALWSCLAASARSVFWSDPGPLPIREKGLGEELVAYTAFPRLHLGVMWALGARVAFPGIVACVPPHPSRKVHALGEALLALGAEPQILSLVHAQLAAAGSGTRPGCVLPLVVCECIARFHLAAFRLTAFACLPTVIAPTVREISFAPHRGSEHRLCVPVAAPLALLLQSVVRALPLTTFAKTLVVLALPLRFRELRFEGFCIASVAHVRRHMLLLHSLPVYVFAAQDLQQ